MAETQRRDGDALDQVFDLVSAYGPDLATLCQAGPALIAETAGIGVSARSGGQAPRTRFTSDPVSARLEAAQLDFGEGPCRDAATGGTVRATDLDDPQWLLRWPRFAPAALDAGVRAVCAVPLHAGGVHHDGAVDLYRRTPGEWTYSEPAATAFAAAAAELLTLEHLDLDLADSFAEQRLGDVVLDLAGGALVDVRPGLAEDLPTLPVARWFTRHTVASLRWQVNAICVERGLPGPDTFRFVLAVHEAMTNVVQHGGGHGQLLLWRRADRLWCEISDHGPGLGTVWPAGGSGEPSGLWLIRQVCASVDVTTDETGTRLRLSYPLPSTIGA
ncbi:ATP-binding protein [Actinoplanes awajinensis]|uniref:Histidine kinase/HSP90-like ATPase domain-containing protein n=1 Tax=Actinoplanes awajinensis subsp. mycoplanecinus TaxID=135947 RepID=A0A124GA23_9ACTN|nr:ATP-binding protein [Actinoplanes awajinensis]KUL30820.1 hypothetical protein ADL15_22900 [Actinoplanes awajinensis subsp. mycoplanecinus]